MEVTITNLGGSIKIYDTRFSPEVTDLTVLKDGISIKRFGNIVRLTLVEGNWLDIDYTEVLLINFTYSTTPTDSEEFYDELWKILEYYCDCSPSTPTECSRQLENGSVRLLEDGSLRLLEEECSSGGGGVWGAITGDIEDQTDLIDLVDASKSRVLLSEITASSSATIDFEGLFSEDYDYYEVVFYDVVPVTNASDFVLRVGTGATPTYHSGGTDYSHHRVVSGAVGTGTVMTNGAFGDGNDSQIVMYGAAVSNTTERGISGTLRIINPLGTNLFAHIYFELLLVTTAGSTYRSNGAGFYLATTAVTALRFFSNTGNISTGTFRLYGIK
jgi:hypothetical protein